MDARSIAVNGCAEWDWPLLPGFDGFFRCLMREWECILDLGLAHFWLAHFERNNGYCGEHLLKCQWNVCWFPGSMRFARELALKRVSLRVASMRIKKRHFIGPNVLRIKAINVTFATHPSGFLVVGRVAVYFSLVYPCRFSAPPRNFRLCSQILSTGNTDLLELCN